MRVRSTFIVGVVLQLVVILVVVTTSITTSIVNDDKDTTATAQDQLPTTTLAPSTSVSSQLLLRQQVRKLRKRQRAVYRQRRSLDIERTKLEEEINALRTKLDELAPENVDETSARTKQITELETEIYVYETKKQELDRALALLSVEAGQVASDRSEAVARLQQISLDSVVLANTEGLPEILRGAIRKSTWAVTPFFNMLYTAVDTNDRLVTHVGEEIERYTHIGVGASPFMSGMLFYCVLLIPALTLCVLVRGVIDQSTKLTHSHAIIFGNIYLVAVCVIFFLANLLHRDPMRTLASSYQRFMVLSNLVLAIYYFWLLGTLGFHAVSSKLLPDIAQFVAACSAALHYFLFAWRRIFTNTQPSLLIFNYLIYATIFSLITYEHCVRIDARWFTDFALIRLFRDTDTPLPHWRALLNRSNLRFVQRRLLSYCQRANVAFISLVHRLKRRRKRRRGSNSPPTNTRIVTSTSRGGGGRRRRSHFSHYEVLDPSDSSVDSSSDDSFSEEDDDDAYYEEPLLSRTTARGTAYGKFSAVLASCSRSGSAIASGSGSGSGGTEVEGRRWWWWPRDNLANSKGAGARTPNRRAKYERSNARPRKEREADVLW